MDLVYGRRPAPPRSRLESDLEVINRIRKKRAEFESFSPRIRNIYAFSDMMNSLEKLPVEDPASDPSENETPSETAPAESMPEVQPRSRRTSSVRKHKDICPKKDAETEPELQNGSPVYPNRLSDGKNEEDEEEYGENEVDHDCEICGACGVFEDDGDDEASESGRDDCVINPDGNEDTKEVVSEPAEKADEPVEEKEEQEKDETMAPVNVIHVMNVMKIDNPPSPLMSLPRRSLSVASIPITKAMEPIRKERRDTQVDFKSHENKTEEKLLTANVDEKVETMPEMVTKVEIVEKEEDKSFKEKEVGSKAKSDLRGMNQFLYRQKSFAYKKTVEEPTEGKITERKPRLSTMRPIVSVESRPVENIFNFLKMKDDTVNKHGFIDELSNRGILSDDPRISKVIGQFRKHEMYLQKDVFTSVISDNVGVIERAFSNSNIIHNFEKFSAHVNDIYNDCKGNDEGTIADYIPQLAKQNPDHFGLSICTVDGQRLNIGDSDVNFCIQSCAKPISYCLAVEENGIDSVHKHVGREPSGVRFNALKVNKDGLPHNPLINSGAIMICSLIKRHLQSAERFDYVLKQWHDLAGGMQLGFSNSVYLSERDTADRNFALAHFMKENKAFPENVNIIDVLEFYFQCCSLTLTSNYLSIVAGSLANGGVCPLTGIQVFTAETVKHCLSMMYSCGLYDYSGEFAFNIGLPAKSGVAGGLFVVIPNVMGICTFSPRLDKYGNSVRGVDFFSKFMSKFNFHMFDCIEVTDTGKEDPRQHSDVEDVTVERIVKYSSVGDITALRRLRAPVAKLANSDYDHRTPLHLASSNGHLNVAKYILDIIGMDNINPVDRWKGTPYDDALREGHLQVAEFLRAHGGKSGSEV